MIYPETLNECASMYIYIAFRQCNTYKFKLKTKVYMRLATIISRDTLHHNVNKDAVQHRL